MPTIKIATYNMNNLFERVKVMELDGFSKEAKTVLDDVKKLNELLEKSSYAGTTGTKIIQLLIKYFFVKKSGKYSKKENPYIYINEVREKLYSVSQDGSGPKLKATGRASWYGWIDFKKSDTNDKAIINTGRVMDAVKADIVCCVEIDNRLALQRFSEIMKKEFGFSYPHTMCIDGNDERGIDVGAMSLFPFGAMVSHIDDLAGPGSKSKIFSRDCPEYEIAISNSKSLYLLCNHFKSKGYGSPATSNARRKLQADAVAEILKKYDLKKDLVVVAGDFNDTPTSAPLAKLLSTNHLKDVLKSPLHNGPTWTYHTGNEQIDYLLVSEPLFNALQSVGIERRGILKRGNVSFPEVDSKANQASDHACVWASFTI